MNIQMILAPIQDELAQIEARLLAEARTPYPRLNAALDRLFQAGGKRVRPALAILSAHAAPGSACDADRVIVFATGVELLHTATLVHDDMVDRADLRRGQPTLNTMLHPGIVVLLGDYLFARAAVLGADVKSVPLMVLFARTLETICNGELRQAFSNRDWHQSKEAYYHKIYSKTAALFVLATQGGAMLAEAPTSIQEALQEYGRKLGLAFQIVDDILDFTGSTEELGKPAGSDLRQGTVTLPVLHYLADAPADNAVQRYLDHGIEAEEPERQRQLTDALTAIIDSSAIESACHEAQVLAQEAQSALQSLPDSPYRRSLHALSEYVVCRQY